MSLTEPEFAFETCHEVCAAICAVLPRLHVSTCNCCIDVIQATAHFSKLLTILPCIYLRRFAFHN